MHVNVCVFVCVCQVVYFCVVNYLFSSNSLFSFSLTPADSLSLKPDFNMWHFALRLSAITVLTSHLHSLLLKWQIVCLVFIAMFSLFLSHVLLSLLLKCVHKKYDLYFTLKTSFKPQENVSKSLNLILLQDENIYQFVYETPTVGVRIIVTTFAFSRQIFVQVGL